MQSVMPQCFVASSSGKVGGVILFGHQSMLAAVTSSHYTVGVLEMVLGLHTHDLGNAKTSGVVRNVSIIIDGIKSGGVDSYCTWKAGSWQRACGAVRGWGGWQGLSFSSQLRAHW